MGRAPLAYVRGDMNLIMPFGRAGIPCVAVCRRDEPPAFSRFVCGRVERTDAWTEQEAQVEALIAHARRRSDRPILYYGGDPELQIVSRYRDLLSSRFRFVVARREFVEQCLAKLRFSELASAAGLSVPRTAEVDPGGGRMPDMRWPVIVKPLTREEPVWAPFGASSKAVEVGTPTAFIALCERLAKAGVEVIAQESIPGPESRVE